MLLHKVKLKNYTVGKNFVLEAVSFVQSRSEGRDLCLTLTVSHLIV